MISPDPVLTVEVFEVLDQTWLVNAITADGLELSKTVNAPNAAQAVEAAFTPLEQ